MNEEEVDAFLAHYGVLGMKWGRRKEETDASRLSAINKRLPKLDRKKNLLRRALPAEATIAGAGNSAKTAKRILRLKETKAPDGSVRLDPSEKTQAILDKYDTKTLNSKITRRAVGRSLGTGLAATSVILGGAAVAYNKLPDKQVALGLSVLAALQASRTLTISLGTLAVGIDAARDAEAAALKKERRAIIKQGHE